MTKILVVDDVPDMASLMASVVKRHGYEVIIANNGQHAMELAEAERPDAILLDIMMPHMNGIDVLHHLKEDKKLHETPVILVSANSEDTDVIKGLEAGAFDYITKPFKSEILAARLRSAVRVKKDHDKIREINQQLQKEIVKRKRQEQELVQTQKLEAIGQLAAGIAHEINTPSQYIGDNIRFLQDAFEDIHKLLKTLGNLTTTAKDHTSIDTLLARIENAIQEADLKYLVEETPRAIRQSLEGIDKVAGIVRAMKEFSHPGSAEKQVVDLNRAIENTLIVSRNEWKYVAEMGLDLDSNLPLASCYPSEINQVLLNLIVNAAQAISERNGENAKFKGTITIRTHHDGDWAEIRIEDTGTGIPEKIHSKVFDHFFTTKAVGKGTGQGLTIAHAIVVEKHGGTISFETEVGKGTTFIVRLPLAGRPASAQSIQLDEVEMVC